MSVYLIIPSLPCSYVKAGKTGKVEETDVAGYLYRRYRTPYGKGLVAYIWRCPTDYNIVEIELIKKFHAYRSVGDELFVGERISQMIFDYCCRNVNKTYIRYQSGHLIKQCYTRGHRVESPEDGVGSITRDMERLTVSSVKSNFQIRSRGSRGRAKSTRGRASTKGGDRKSTRGGSRASTRGNNRKSTRGGSRASTRGGSRKSTRGSNSKSTRGSNTRGEDSSSWYCVIC